MICCLWGDWPDQGWGEEYVVRLRNAVERNLTIPHRFICFADRPERVPDGIEARELRPPHALRGKGCLPKLFAYSPDAGLEGPTLLLDLDNVIVGSLDDIAAYQGRFCARARLPEFDQGKSVLDGDMIMFRPDAALHLWSRISDDPGRIAEDAGGRERFFLADHMPDGDVWQAVCPGQVVSYKHHVRRDGLHQDARIVSFHGRPRPHEVDLGWIGEHWR